MIVIGRSLNELVRIGSSITVQVLRIADKQVTLGIEAPRAVPVDRDELVTGSTPDVKAYPADGEMRVLIVDSTPIHAWLIERSFHAHGGYRPQVTVSARQALAALGLDEDEPNSGSALVPHLIVMELQLPDMPGLELLRRIRSSPRLRTVPVVVMCYSDSDSDVARCLESGANAFMPKPETQEGFRQTVHCIADFWSHARHVSAPRPSLALVSSLA